MGLVVNMCGCWFEIDLSYVLYYVTEKFSISSLQYSHYLGAFGGGSNVSNLTPSKIEAASANQQPPGHNGATLLLWQGKNPANNQYQDHVKQMRY